MSSEPAISVHNISKEYKLGLTGRSDSLLKILERRIRHPIRTTRAPRERFLALDDVTFDVAPGEAVGVIGRNGAGKSTLLKILSRITPPTNGYIDIAGSVGSLLEVGTGFHPELTGMENIYLNGSILGMTKRDIDGRLDEIIDFAEVQRFMETPVKRYSSGMRVRLAFAVAAYLEPEVLIIDEVLSVGDTGFQSKCIARMKSISSDDGRTVVYVTHNLVTLEHLCPRTIVLVDGRVTFDGPTDDAVARYLGSIPKGERGPTTGIFDLTGADRTERGYQKIFKEVVLRPSGGRPGTALRMGEPLQIELEVEGLDEFPEASVAVVVGADRIGPLFRMASEMVPLMSCQARQPSERIVLNIPFVPLTPREYSIDVMVRGGGRVLDWVSPAASFEVVPTDLFGSGYNFGTQETPVVVRWDWELRPSDEQAAVSPGA